MKVLITRSKTQSQEFADLIVQLGFEPLFLPMIEITKPDSWNHVDETIHDITRYTGIIFTSTNGVRYFFERILEVGSLKQCKSKTFYAVGDKTKKAIEEFGFRVSAIPEKYSSEELAKTILDNGEAKTQQKFLFPHGNLTDETIEQAFQHTNIHLDSIIVYNTVKSVIQESQKKYIEQELLHNSFNAITFFSPSSVRHFLEEFPIFFSAMTTPVAVIGETTKKACLALDCPMERIHFIQDMFKTPVPSATV